MKSRVYVSAVLDAETALALEEEAMQRRMRLSPLVRQVLQAHVSWQKAQTAPVAVPAEATQQHGNS